MSAPVRSISLRFDGPATDSLGEPLFGWYLYTATYHDNERGRILRHYLDRSLAECSDQVREDWAPWMACEPSDITLEIEP